MKKEWFDKQEEFKQALFTIKDWETKAIVKMENPSYKENMKKFNNKKMWNKPIPYWYSFNLGRRKVFKNLGLAQGIVFDTDEQKDEFLDWINGDYKAPYIWFLTKEMWDYKRSGIDSWKEYYMTRQAEKDHNESVKRAEQWIDDGDLDLSGGISFGLPEKKWWEFWK